MTAKAADYSLIVDVAKKGVNISPELYGLFFEDINYAADGGIYANLVQNGSFEFGNRYCEDKFCAWENLSPEKGWGSVSVKSEAPLNENNQNYLRMVVEGEFGIINKGFDGIYVIQDDSYLVSMYARSQDFEGTVEISLEDLRGEIIGKTTIDQGFTGEWAKYENLLYARKTDDKARLVIKLKGKGTVDLDMVSLFPEKAWNGILRCDLVKLMKDFKPGFLRFPGGCIVEGDSFENIYRWKNTIGDPARRRATYNLWYGEEFPHYHQSLGLGFFEYFLLSEYLNARPLPILNCGMTCQARGGGPLPLGEVNEFIQDALDLIEFANSRTETKWGKTRESLGHPQPFNLNFLGIGNEQWGSAYFNRYSLFHEAIKRRYPDVNLIAGAGPSPDDTLYHEAMKWVTNLFPEERPDFIDEHIYRSPEWFYTSIHRYDNYDRNLPDIFIGELAAHNEKRSNNLETALAEAAFLTAIEENSDVVKMVSYAPLLAKIGYNQWKPNFIWFTNTESWGSVNYQVWKTFSQNLGDYTVESYLSKSGEEPFRIRGTVGLGSHRNVLFDNIRIMSGDDLVYEESFSAPSELGYSWETLNGDFEILEEQLLSSHQGTGSSMIVLKNKLLGGDCRLSLDFKITQRGGKAVIYPGVIDEKNYIAVNLGSADSFVELVVNGKSYEISPHNYQSISMNKWHNASIEIRENKIKLDLSRDDIDEAIKEPLFDVTVNPKLGPLYVTASVEKESGDILIKAVNSSPDDLTCSVDIRGVDYIHHVGLCTVVSGDINDENSIQNPLKVIPLTEKIDVSPSFEHTFGRYSVTVLRLRTKPEDFPRPPKFEISTLKDEIDFGETLRIEITNSLVYSEENDFADVVVLFETDHPKQVKFNHDITTGYQSLVLLKKPEDTAIEKFKIWAKMKLNGDEIKSNVLEIEVKGR